MDPRTLKFTWREALTAFRAGVSRPRLKVMSSQQPLGAGWKAGPTLQGQGRGRSLRMPGSSGSPLFLACSPTGTAQDTLAVGVAEGTWGADMVPGSSGLSEAQGI